VLLGWLIGVLLGNVFRNGPVSSMSNLFVPAVIIVLICVLTTRRMQDKLTITVSDEALSG
jgi:hypothetical protein